MPPGAQSGNHNPLGEGEMYIAPRLERYGTFRELTKVGFLNTADGHTIPGDNGPVDGNNLCGTIPGVTCVST
jgi:hypothetical protein